MRRTHGHVGWAIGCAVALAAFAAMAWAQDQPASRPVINLPPETHSVRAAKPEVSVIAAVQPNFPAEITHNSHTAPAAIFFATERC